MSVDSQVLRPGLNAGADAGESSAYRVLARCWRLPSLALAGVVFLPLLVVFAAWLQPEAEIWRHLAETVLRDLVANTLVLIVGVACGVLLIGVGLAWLTTMCDFPGRRFFDWALMLPLAMPAYVLAFVAVGLFDYAGPLQSRCGSTSVPAATGCPTCARPEASSLS